MDDHTSPRGEGSQAGGGGAHLAYQVRGLINREGEAGMGPNIRPA